MNKKLKAAGFAHVVVLAVFLAGFSLVGVYLLVKSNAQTPDVTTATATSTVTQVRRAFTPEEQAVVSKIAWPVATKARELVNTVGTYTISPAGCDSSGGIHLNHSDGTSRCFWNDGTWAWIK